MEPTLRELIEEEVGEPDARRGQPFWLCPFHPDENPLLTTYTHAGKERWKCFGCGKGGDAIDFLRLLHPEMTFGEARERIFSLRGKIPHSPGGFRRNVGILTPSLSTLKRKIPRCQDTGENRAGSVVSSPPSWWRVVVQGSAARLPSSPLLAWLHARGLTDDTIHEARLGVNVEGLVIPWFSLTGEVRAVIVRRNRRQPKYRLYEGSERGVLYPAVRLDYRKPVLLCEGELDTLLARQEVGDLVQAVTLGSASGSPSPSTLTHLSLTRVLYVATDADEAGDGAYQRLSKLLRHARRVRPPEGQDLTDVHRDVGLRNWIGELGVTG
jgi:hypothetical protein